MRNSSYTGRSARSLSDAFGPYTSQDLQPMRDERHYSRAWWAWMVVIAAVTFVLIFTTR